MIYRIEESAHHALVCVLRGNIDHIVVSIDLHTTRIHTMAMANIAGEQNQMGPLGRTVPRKEPVPCIGFTLQKGGNSAEIVFL